MTEAPNQPLAPVQPVAPETSPTELQRLALQEAAHADARPLQVQAVIWLFRAYSAAMTQTTEAIRPQHISMSAFNVLQALVNTPEGELEPCELAERLLVSRPSITGLIDTLEAKELVARRPHPADRRRVLVRLSEAGRALLDRHYPDHYAALEHLFGDLDEHELAELVSYLRRVRGAVPASLAHEQAEQAEQAEQVAAAR